MGDSDNTRGKALIPVNVGLGVIETLAVILRLLARRKGTVELAADDFWLLGSLLPSYLMMVCGGISMSTTISRRVLINKRSGHEWRRREADREPQSLANCNTAEGHGMSDPSKSALLTIPDTTCCVRYLYPHHHGRQDICATALPSHLHHAHISPRYDHGRRLVYAMVYYRSPDKRLSMSAYQSGMGSFPLLYKPMY